MTKKLKIIFMGTPDYAVTALRHLMDSDHEVIAVYSQPPRAKGRGQQVQLSPVHEQADKAGIPVFTPKDFKDAQTVKDFENLGADVAVVAAYGLILPKDVLDAPKYGSMNIHFSLLPRWRGAAPVQSAIWAGDEETGVSIMQMAEGLDTGPVIAERKVLIHPQSTTESLSTELWALGSVLLLEVLEELAEKGGVDATPQAEEGVTHAKSFSKDDGKIDWGQSAVEIDRQIRALNPWPGTWCILPNGKRLKILEASPPHPPASGGEAASAAGGEILSKQGHIACGDGSVLQLLKVQPENSKAMDFAAALNGGHIKVGECLQ